MFNICWFLIYLIYPTYINALIFKNNKFAEFKYRHAILFLMRNH